MRVSSEGLARAEAPAAAGTAVAVAAVSFTHGGYFPREWGWALLAVALAAVLAVLARDRLAVGRLETATIVLLCGFAGWTALSALWSPSAAQPLLAAERALVYAAAVAAALLLTRAARADALAAGAAAAAVVVCGYALLTRLVPGWLTSYPPDGYQLQDPIGYWNGLAILAAVGAVAAAGLAAEAGARAVRAAAAGALPPLATALYLTFSRGGLAACAAGLCIVVAVARDRLRVLAVLALLAPAVAFPAWETSRHHALTRAGATLGAARGEGWRVGALLLAAVAVAFGIGWSLPALERRVHVGPRVRRLVGAGLYALLLLAVVAVVVRAGGPAGIASRVSDSFTRSLPATGGDLNRRLTSFSSDGRSDYWRVGWREVGAHPLLGGGAGSWAAWWERYRPTPYDAQNTHNLYLETLAELGPVGLALLLGALALPFAAAVRSRGRPGVTAAAGAFSAFVVHAALDWDFQIVAVTLAALLCAAGLLAAARRERPPRPLSTRARAGAVAVLLPLAALAIAVQVGNSALADASAALDRGEIGQADRLAHRARTWQPWSYQPWQLLGQTALARGLRPQARRDFEHALADDRSDWELWLDLAQASSGAARAHALGEARRLNPRAPEVGR